MSDCEECTFSDDDFSGVARLFPLPNLVVFPYVMQPLHIFEPRYRAMFEAALAGDRLITMALLAPGWEKNYEGRPAVHPVGCLCRIATHQKLENGTYNVLLIGMRRVRIVAELPPDQPYREARAEIVSDEFSPLHGEERMILQRRLLEALKQVIPKLPDAHDQLDQLLGSEISLGMLTDIVAYTLDMNIQAKQELLAEPCVARRAKLLLDFVAAAEGATAPAVQCEGEKFPPDFSAN